MNHFLGRTLDVFKEWTFLLEGQHHGIAVTTSIVGLIIAILVKIRSFDFRKIKATMMSLIITPTARTMATGTITNTTSTTSSISCPNPNCIRCQRYREIQKNAQKRMPWVLYQIQSEFGYTTTTTADITPTTRIAATTTLATTGIGESSSSLDRIVDSIRHPKVYCTEYQAPTVLMVRDLPSKAVVTEFHNGSNRHSEQQQQEEEEGEEGLINNKENDDNFRTENHLQKDIVNTLLEEISQVPKDLWKRNDTLSTGRRRRLNNRHRGHDDDGDGKWEVLMFLNQGLWDKALQYQCPKLYTFLLGFQPNLLEDCLFGNIMISKVYAGTIIEPHCGPTNVRHRLQYTLQVPSIPPPPPSSSSSWTSSSSLSNTGPTLFVSDGGKTVTELKWNQPGEYFVFDDSMIHSLEYPFPTVDLPQQRKDNDSNDDVGDDDDDVELFRMVLIVDLWHPHLTAKERAFIRYMYPPFTSDT